MSTRKPQPEETDMPDPSMTEPIEAPDEVVALIADLQGQLDEAVEARKRAQADFVNYQNRAEQNQRQAVLGGEAGVVRSILGVLDHFDLALDQDTEQLTVEQLLGGVRIVRAELVKALERYDVRPVQPAPGDEFDPNLHQAVLHQEAQDIPPDHIVAVLQAGYTMGTIVLRPAKVSIAPPPAPPDEEGE